MGTCPEAMLLNSCLLFFISLSLSFSFTCCTYTHTYSLTGLSIPKTQQTCPEVPHLSIFVGQKRALYFFQCFFLFSLIPGTCVAMICTVNEPIYSTPLSQRTCSLYHTLTFLIPPTPLHLHQRNQTLLSLCPLQTHPSFSLPPWGGEEKN